MACLSQPRLNMTAIISLPTAPVTPTTPTETFSGTDILLGGSPQSKAPPRMEWIGQAVTLGLVLSNVSNFEDVAQLVLVLLLALCGFVCHLVINQERLLFVPLVQVHPDWHAEDRSLLSNPPGMRSPKDVGLEHFREVTFNSTGPDASKAQLYGWFLEGAKDKSKTILMFSSNGGNIGHRLSFYKELHERLGYNMFVFDYRGYGNSQGEPNEPGLLADGVCALQFLCKLKQDDEQHKVFLFGQSLGGSVAIHTMCTMFKEVSISGVIVENSFTSIREVALSNFPPLLAIKPLIKPPILRHMFGSLQRLNEYQGPLPPILFIRGEQDELLPSNHTDLLLQSVQSKSKKASLVSFENGHHSDLSISIGEPYYQALVDFYHNN